MRAISYVFLPLVFIPILSSCSRRNFVPYRSPHHVIVVVDEAALYERDPAYPSKIGRSGGTYTGYGDTIRCDGELRTRVGKYYAVTITGNPYWIEDGEAISLYDYSVLLQSLGFRLKAVDDPLAWNRAAVFLAEHSPWPIALEGEYVLRTDQSADFFSSAMQVSRLVIGDSVEFEISPSRLPGDNVPRLHIAKSLAYFMRTGKERPKE